MVWVGDRGSLCHTSLLLPLVSAGLLDGIQFVTGLVFVAQDNASHILRAMVQGLEGLCCSSSSPVSLGLSLQLFQWDGQPTRDQMETVLFTIRTRMDLVSFHLTLFEPLWTSPESR